VDSVTHSGYDCGMANTKSETIRARVDTELKAEAEAIFAECGLNASEAIRLFYRQVILHRGLPFAVRIPNAETRQAMAEAEAGEGLTRYDNFDDFLRTMTDE
jgi:DNA-damage-inducible protein J